LPFDLQVNSESNIPKEISNVRKTGTSNVKQNNNANVSASFISLNQLKAHTRGRAQTRSESVWNAIAYIHFEQLSIIDILPSH
jgi:hypothetical protein